jgi:hypothetical protein
MSTEHLIPEDLQELYHVKEWRNATGILATACPEEWRDIQDVLRSFRLMSSEVIVGGGNRSLISRRIDEALYAKGWQEKAFATSSWSIRIGSIVQPTPSIASKAASRLRWNGITKTLFSIATLTISACSSS